MTHSRPSRNTASSAINAVTTIDTQAPFFTTLKPSVRLVRGAIIVMVAAVVIASVPVDTVFAAEPNTNAVAQKAYSIPAGALSPALSAFAGSAGVNLSSEPALTEGLRTQGLQGSYTVQEGFARLLSGSGLEAVSRGSNVYVLNRLPAKSSLTPAETTLPAVTATATLNATTEGTSSYTARALTIGKMTQSIRETPQSVSVVTRQQMDDKNLTTLEEVLGQATGVTKSQRNFGSHTISVRGFNLDTFLVDGVAGTAYNPTGWLPVDMAIYDRVEVLRGASGLIVGSADPSGAVNMVRKRPRADKHFDVSFSAGSWNNYRTEIDAGGALNEEGTVRGRVVAAYQDRDSYIDLIHSKEPLFYGIVEADLSKSTTLAVGFRHQQNKIDGYTVFGLPRYNNGRALDVSRSTSLGQNWNQHDATANEVFADLEHRFNSDWKSKISFNRIEAGFDQKVAIARGAVNPVTLTGTNLYTRQFRELSADGTGVDASLSGNFQAWGGNHQVVVGANWSRLHTDDKTATSAITPQVPINVFNPNHSAVAEGARPAWASEVNAVDERYGVYASTRLQLAEPLHALLGARVSWLKYKSSNLITNVEMADYKQDSEFTPYAGLVYDLNKQWSVYTSYADTFMPQSSYLTQSGAPLKPAVGANYEAGVKGELYGGRLNLTFAVFSIKKNNIAVEDFSAPAGACPASLADTNCYRNGSTLRSKGFEIEATGEVSPGWQVAAGYTNVKSRDDDGKSISSETPRHLLRASTTYRLPGELNAWTVGGGVSAQSSYSFPAADNAAVTMGESGRAVWDLRSSYRINKTWTAALNIANVFDKSYYAMLGSLARGNYYGEPRNVTLTLRGSF